MIGHYKNSPITFYVKKEGVEEIPDADHFGANIERIIDVQISDQDAKTLVIMLSKKLDKSFGVVSFRLKGKLVI